MKRGLYLALSLVSGAAVASFLLEDPGKLSISLHGYIIEMSIPIAVLLLLSLYATIYVCTRLLTARTRNAELRLNNQRQRSQQHLARGLIELSAGEWSKAEQTLTRSAYGATYPVVHYLAAARAAELQNAYQRRDEWLTKALDVAPYERAAVHITQAEMLLRHNQLNAALAALEQLDASDDQNTRGLSLLARIYRQQGDWQKLKQLEPKLRDSMSIEPHALDEVIAQIHMDSLNAAGSLAELQNLDHVWREVPKAIHQRPDVAVTYAHAAMKCGAYDRAEKTLRELLDLHWNEAALLAYGELTHDANSITDPLALLHTVEKWLNSHPRDATLLLTCARCCIRNELYGKARSYLEASIGIQPKLETYQMLANLLEVSGERDGAFKLLQSALSHAIGRKSSLPRLRALRNIERRQGKDRRN